MTFCFALFADNAEAPCCEDETPEVLVEGEGTPGSRLACGNVSAALPVDLHCEMARQ